MSENGDTRAARRGKGFRRTGVLVQSRVKGVGAKRGFAVTRVLTHWPEIVGDDIARATRPVDVRYGREGLGATLTLLVKGAEAPLLEMQKERIRDTVNACYGYNAIARIRFTQTAATGFADPPEPYSAAPKPAAGPDRAALAAAEEVAGAIEDPGLRQALEALGGRILSHPKQQKKV